MSLTSSSCSHARLQRTLDSFIFEVRSGKRERSIISCQTVEALESNNELVWDDLRRELEDIGLSTTLLIEKRQFIVRFFQDAIASGRLREVASSDDASVTTQDQTKAELHNTVLPAQNYFMDDVMSTYEEYFKLSRPTIQARSTPQEGLLQHFKQMAAGVADLTLPPGSCESRSGKPSPVQNQIIMHELNQEERNGEWDEEGEAAAATAAEEEGLEALENGMILLLAAANGNPYWTKVILDDHAIIDLDSRDSVDGCTALHCAAMKGWEEVAVMLLNRGASVNTKNKLGVTPLHYAALFGHRNIVYLLLEHHACVNVKSVSGLTPLLVASKYGDLEIIQLLLSNGADVNAQTARGRTALHEAAWLGCEVIVRLLLGEHINVEIIDKKGETALDIAARRGRKSVVRLLLHHGARLNVEVGQYEKVVQEENAGQAS